MEIAPGIHRIKCTFVVNRMVYAHLLIGDEASLLVDTGCAHNPEQEILPTMPDIGLDPADLTYILISHSDLDHQGGDAPMKQVAPQAVLMCHKLDRPWVEDTEALISGEASMWTSILDDDWQPAMPPAYCYIDTYIATQERLMGMNIDILAPSHWPVQKGTAVVEYLAESKNYCLHVEKRLLELAEESGGFTLRQAIDKLGSQLGTWPLETNQDFSYGMLGNLDSLTKRGLLQTSRDTDQIVIWSSVR